MREGAIVVNRQFGTRPIVVHAHGSLRYQPAWPAIKAAAFDAPERRVRATPELTLVTCNNGHPAMGLFERSVSRLGLDVLVCGGGIEPWVNSRDKPQQLSAALAAIETEFVMYADSRDAILLDDPRAALDHLPEGCDLLMGGDRINYPALPRFKDFERALPGAAESEFRYLNAGAWIGRTSFCREVFEQALATVPVSGAEESEQGLLKMLFPTLHPRMQLDYRCEVFQNIGYVFADILTVIPAGDASSPAAITTAP